MTLLKQNPQKSFLGAQPASLDGQQLGCSENLPVVLTGSQGNTSPAYRWNFWRIKLCKSEANVTPARKP